MSPKKRARSHRASGAYGTGPLRFIEAYDGNVRRSAAAAGISYGYARLLCMKPSVRQALHERDQARMGEAISTREERQRFWRDMMRNTDAKPFERLKASELLGKSHGDFLERVEHSGCIGVKPITEMTDEELEVLLGRRSVSNGS